MHLFTRTFRLPCIALAAAAWAIAVRASTVTAAELAETWEVAPYRIHATLAIDAPGDLGEQLAAVLPTYLGERASSSIGSLWRLSIDVAQGPLRQRMLRNIDGITTDELTAPADGDDKRLFVTLRSTPQGFEFSAREYDRYLDRWGPTLRRSTRQHDAVGEQMFSLVVLSVSPLAHVRSDPQDPHRAVLEMRGADLPQSAVDFTAVRPGDVLQPMLRQTTRDGDLLPGGVRPVAWTFLEAIEPEAGTSQTLAKVRNVTEKPLGIRRGRVEQVAVGLRHDPADTIVELRSRGEKDKPLAGYELVAQNMDEKTTRSLGTSDAAGRVAVTPGKSGVQMVLVKSGGLTLAALPIVPGAEPRIEVWLPDDDIRARAAAKLASLREDIVDVVARRTILMARVRQQIEERNLSGAKELLESLGELPGPTQFNVALDRAAQTLRSSDVQVQRRIDRLFSETRSALAKHLDPQSVGALYEEFRQAEEAAKAAAEADPATSSAPPSRGDKTTG